MLGKLVTKVARMKPTIIIYALLSFAVYVVSVYFQFEWRSFLLPIVSVLVFHSILMMHIDIGSSGKWFRSMRTWLFLCHYIFVRAFECFPILEIYFPEGMYKFGFVLISAFTVSVLLIWAGNRNKKIRWLWQ